MSTVLNKASQRLLPEPLGVLGLSVRTTNGLENMGLSTVEDLLQSCPRRSAECLADRAANDGLCRCRRLFGSPALQRRFEPPCYLLDTPNMGEKTLAEIKERLAANGFTAS